MSIFLGRNESSVKGIILRMTDEELIHAADLVFQEYDRQEAHERALP